METNQHTVEHPDGSTTTATADGAQVHTPAPDHVAQAPAGITPPARTPSPAEVAAQAEADGVDVTDAGANRIADLAASITQREWLGIIRALGCSKEEALTEMAYTLPAVCWVSEKRAHGGADWERVLDLTDRELLDLIGMTTPEDQPKVGDREDVDPTSPSGDGSAPSSA